MSDRRNELLAAGDHAAVAVPLPEFAGGAFTANTVRALRADLGIWAAWCAERAVAALPADTDTIAAFVDAMAAVRAPATVRRYVASIALVHRAAGRARPADAAPVKLALKRMHHRHGRRQRQAHPLNWPLRQRLIAAAGDRLIDARNRALVAVAYDALLRRSELAALTVADLAVEPAGWATLLVRRAKNDPERRGAAVYLARDTVALVNDWLGRSGVRDGRLFRSVDKGGRIGDRLAPGQVPRIVKTMAARAGLPQEVVDGLSGHSTRVGAAQDMIARGIGMPAILQAGRWKSAAMVNRYGERLLAARGAVAQLARIQKRG